MPRRRARNTAPPKLQNLIWLLLILAVVWLYQGGYFDRLLGETATDESPAAQAPEQEDGARPDTPPPPEPTLPQPAVPAVPAPPPQQSIDTPSLRGFSGEWYQVYFTKPKYPEREAGRTEGLDEAIIADIDAATQRIELSTFDFDLPKLTQALLRAKQRGVQVRLSVDGENLEDAAVARLTGDLQAAGIPVFFDERQAFMHNKFFVIDNQIVWTGSANMTVNDVFRNNNNMLRIVDPQLAENYTAKADDIFKGIGGTDGGSVLIHPTLTIGGASVVNMFSPDDPITDAIVERLNNAQQKIDVLAFAYTSDPVADAMIAAKQRGLPVRGVMENRNTKGTGSEFAKLREAGIDLHADGNCYIMHNKVIIVDGRTVITGSFNFTRGAQVQNDENVLMIDDPSLAARFTEEFERIYQQALQPPRCG